MIVAEDFLPMLFDFFADAAQGEYVKNGVADYDPVSGDCEESSQSFPVKCLMFDLSSNLSGVALKSGSVIQVGDKQVFVMPPALSDPYVGNFTVDIATDTLLVQGVRYKLLAFKQINPSMGENPLLYEFYCRG